MSEISDLSWTKKQLQNISEIFDMYIRNFRHISYTIHLKFDKKQQKNKSEISNIYNINTYMHISDKSHLKQDKKIASKYNIPVSEIFVLHHMSYIKNLELISHDFVISVQQVKNEKILETSAMQR